MKTVSIAQTRDNLDDLLDQVKRGETIQITQDNQTVALLSPPEPAPVNTDDKWEARAAELEKQGQLRRGKSGIAEILLTPPPGRSPSGVLDALLEERREGR